MSNSIVIYGPMASGKTRNAKKLAKKYKKRKIFDGWDGLEKLPPNCLALTNTPPSMWKFKYPCHSIEEALRE